MPVEDHRGQAWSWPATPDSVPAARRAVVAYLHGAQTPDPPLADIALAVSEALTNVVVHAYRGLVGPMHVEVDLQDEHVDVVVWDEGRGVTPRLDSPGAGLGMPIMAALTQELEMRRGPAGGARLRLRFGR